MTDPHDPDHADEIDPIVFGQWCAAIFICLCSLGVSAWGIYIIVQLVTGA